MIRRVATPEGSKFFGLPMGAPIATSLQKVVEKKQGRLAPLGSLRATDPASTPRPWRGQTVPQAVKSVEGSMDSIMEYALAETPMWVYGQRTEPLNDHTLVWSAKLGSKAGRGDNMGQVKRVIHLDTGEVEHASLSVSPMFRHHGIAARMLERSEAVYRAQGMNQITVHAGDDTGGYAWAKLGFTWADRSPQMEITVAQLIDRVGQKVYPDEALGDTVQALYDRWADEDWPEPIELAMVGYTPGAVTWPGKEALMGSNWFGKLDL